jgi:hypothetical protein
MSEWLIPIALAAFLVVGVAWQAFRPAKHQRRHSDHPDYRQERKP